ncbi:hypothetical protein NL676_008643 [Syzygium grande]|nr:hypothetical protein NL676_008643 [Syzygium grande]
MLFSPPQDDFEDHRRYRGPGWLISTRKLPAYRYDNVDKFIYWIQYPQGRRGSNGLPPPSEAMETDDEAYAV